MSEDLSATCKTVKLSDMMQAQQGTSYFHGISSETTNSRQICMHMIHIPPGSRPKVHKHTNHETAIYVISGEAYTFFGDQLQFVEKTSAGDMLFIPANLPHLPINLGNQTTTGIVARTDPHQSESVVLLPELEVIAEKVINELKVKIQNSI
ncbi:MAG: hypothetical protein RLY40_1516 [Pseudomonadota bacterium]|jgi:uncharacterized RmlC-like cupin family protein